MLDLTKLNKAQREAVETLDGPVLLVAGPGTGKTTVLTYRIAQILSSTDTKPQAILAMTFTEAGVFAMKRKLFELIGQTAYAVDITTIHGFCNSVIQEFPEYFAEIQGFSPLTDIERIRFAQEILEHTEYHHLSPIVAKDMYIPDLLSIISTMKREYVTPARFQEAIAQEEELLQGMEKYVTRGPEKGKKVRVEYEMQQKKIAKYKEVVVFYEHYQSKLRAKQRYDYEDMILFVLEKLTQDSEFRSILQEKYEYLLMDEYQDTNDAQNTLLFTLAAYWGEEANIFAVGDDDQAIYRFQGASVKNIVDFLAKYPTAKVITLTENYRSQQTVLNASREFIRHNTQSLEKTLQEVNKALEARAHYAKKKLRLATFHRGEAENLFIAEKIQQLVKHKRITYENIAILVRNNADMDAVVDMLQRKRIPYVRKAGDNALVNHYVQQLLSLVRLISLIGTDEVNDLLLVKILHFPYLAIPKLDLLKIGRAYPEYRIDSLWAYIAKQGKEVNFDAFGLSLDGKEKVLAFFDQVISWYSASFREPLVKILELLMHESGLLNHVLAEKDKVKHLNALNSFFAEVKALNVSEPDMTVQEFLVAIDLMKEFRIPIKEKDLGVPEKGVQIMTAHSSKGLEFDIVFIPQLYSTKWDNKRTRPGLSLPKTLTGADDAVQAMEEDRRLLYVAMTRAKRRVYLSYATVYSSTFGKEKEVHPSLFLNEIPNAYIKQLSTEKYTSIIQEHIADLLAPRPFNTVYINSVDERDVIRTIVSKFDLHPTGLNNYLACPMSFLLGNLLRIPGAMSPSLAYGNAYHDALLKLYSRKKMNEPLLTEKEFFAVFAQKLTKYPLRASQRAKLLEKGEKNLSLYYQTYADKLILPVKNEHKLTGVVSGARLKGRVDRIDYVDKERKFLKVVDYKTGKALSPNAFDTMHPSGEFPPYNYEKAKAQRYYNQLLFYKVVADLDWWMTSNGAQTVIGSLFFVDPQREQFVECEVEYVQADVEDMKALIIDVWNKIQKLEFPRVHGTDDDCDYCSIGVEK